MLNISQIEQYYPENLRAFKRNILLSQKIYVALNRKRAKGRDFFDILFLLQKTKPNYGYLEKKVGIKDEAELKNGLIKQIGTINLEEIAKNVEPFLFHPSDSKRVEMFGEYIGQIFRN